MESALKCLALMTPAIFQQELLVCAMFCLSAPAEPLVP
jgi:hypothetical protein